MNIIILMLHSIYIYIIYIIDNVHVACLVY